MIKKLKRKVEGDQKNWLLLKMKSRKINEINVESCVFGAIFYNYS